MTQERHTRWSTAIKSHVVFKAAFPIFGPTIISISVMPKKRMSEDAKLVIEGARGNLEKKARQSLEVMDESKAMTSDTTAQADDSRTQDAAVSLS